MNRDRVDPAPAPGNTEPMSLDKTPGSIGPLVRSWRAAKGKSQLDLAIEAGISSRHLSFVETGRANPSREMVLMLAEALGVPLRERNAWLEAAGFAAVYRETPLDAPAMDDVRGALTHILEAHVPNPALVVNRRYDLLMANGPAQRLVAFFAPEWRGPSNILCMLLGADGLRPAVENWKEIAGHVVHRVRGELSSAPRDPADEAILAQAIAAEGELSRPRPPGDRSPQIVVPIKLRRGRVALDLFTTITTLGTPLDITLQELRIETLFPVNGAARAALRTVVDGTQAAS